MKPATIVFSATGTIQTYRVEMPGMYAIEAAGAQAGATVVDSGAKGARLSGMFSLKKGDLLKIVVGRRGAPANAPHQLLGGSGGSSLVWTGSSDLPQPIKLMLSARGGKAAHASPVAASIAADVGGWMMHPEIDPATTQALSTQWTRVAETRSDSTLADHVRIDRAGYNAGAFPSARPNVQEGDGFVSIRPVMAESTDSESAPILSEQPASHNSGGTRSATGGQVLSSSAPATAAVPPPTKAPSPTVLPQVAPRARLLDHLLRSRRPGKRE
ncbi:glycine-rich protein [Opitutus terrae]|uniref:receptor protein-tyrosine kinase n=1 Tax=Opitutus terrae (strain DSM 11246 / JCM 15787 / PB90-1) TaxID=452637 RepID=B1ZSA4_OPITP|nr:glycine-rich protein [Opitutus terrae]ACB75703.1 hypothetical protein Oter_2421 [Opitutus terrae PB90-1]